MYSRIFKKLAVYAIFLLGMLEYSVAGPLAYGICQTGCNALAVSCYAAGGYIFGTVTAGTGVPGTIAACNVGLGFSMTQCVVAGFSPTL
jgi:hypothetical protein